MTMSPGRPATCTEAGKRRSTLEAAGITKVGHRDTEIKCLQRRTSLMMIYIVKSFLRALNFCEFRVCLVITKLKGCYFR